MYTRVPISPHLHQYLLLSLFLTVIILTGVRLCLIVVLTYISLVITDVEHLVIGFLAIYISFLKNVYSNPLSIFKMGYLLLSCWSSLYILDIKSLSHIWFSNIFSDFIDCLFIRLIVSFVVQKF